jgi:hypothetical protein
MTPCGRPGGSRFQCPSRLSEELTAWIDLLVIGSVFLRAAVIMGASRQREAYLCKLDLQAQKMGSPERHGRRCGT